MASSLCRLLGTKTARALQVRKTYIVNNSQAAVETSRLNDDVVIAVHVESHGYQLGIGGIEKRDEKDKCYINDQKQSKCT